MDVKTAVNTIASYLIENNRTITFAESATAGLLASTFTDLPGVSACFKGSIVSYSDEVKAKLLNIDKAIIDEYSAVSIKVCDLMVKNVAKMFNADYAISVTGYAGPTGGSKSDPVGTVYIGIKTPSNTLVLRKYYPNMNRDAIRMNVVIDAFSYLAENL